MEDRIQILIVEDDPVTRRAVVKAVRSAGDQVSVEVAEESDGHAALAALRRRPFDCAFLDYQLPGLDGLSLLRQARAEGIKTPIIVLTARGDEQLAVEMMKAGAADYLSKSRMSPEALWQSLRNAVRVHRAELRAAEATERLRENEERLSRVLETTLDGIIILDRDGRYLYFNPAAERIFGVGPMEVTGLSLEHVPWMRTRGDGTLLPLSEHTFNLVLASGQPVRSQEMGVIRHDGSRVVVSINAAPLTDPDGSISGVVASLRDVTEQRRAQEALRHERDFTSAIVETSGSLIIVLDPDGRIVRFNNSCQRVTGYAFGEVEGRFLWDLFLPPDEVEAFRGVVQRLAGGEFPSHYENHWLTRTGRRRLISWANTCITDPEGRVEYIIGTGIDITEERAAEVALRRSQQDYASLVNTIDGIVWEALAASFTFTFVSPQAERLLGYPVQRWIDDPTFWETHVHPDDRTWAKDYCIAATSRGEDHDFEYRMIAADGRIIWIRDVVTLVRDGDVVKLRGLMLDVTASKRAEALRETHNRVLRMLATGASLEDVLDTLARGVEEQLPGGFCGVLVKDPAADRLRWAAAPSVPRAYIDATPPGGVPILPDAGSCGTAACRRQRVIVQDIATDPLWNRARAGALAAGVHACWSQPILTANGEVLGTFAVFYDQPRAPLEYELHAVDSAVGLAEIAIRRKRDEAALRETNQTLRTLVTNSPLPIITFDRQRRLRTFNPAAERVFGFTEAEALSEVIDGDDEATTLIDRVLAGEVFTGIDIQRARKDGSVVDVSFSAAPLFDGHGQISGAITVLMDVTERNRLKEQLLQSQKMEAVGRLAGGIAHDFNNLLAIISGYSESLTRKLTPGDPLHTSSSEIQKAADRGASLTRQLLAFSRRQTVKPQKLDLNQVVDHVHEMLRRVISDRVAIELKPARSLRPIEADPGQMEQVLINLSLNARDAMPGGGTITIKTANVDLKPAAAQLAGLKPGPYVRLSVADTGQGMDEATRQRIFEPFFTTKDIGKGTGLGLSIVYGIAQQCGGTVSVESKPGQGARFDVHIPALRDAVATASAAAVAAGQ